MTTTNYERAMASAREYRETAEREGSNHAKCYELRDQIFGWVGRWNHIGLPILPEAIRREMGLAPGSYESKYPL